VELLGHREVLYRIAFELTLADRVHQLGAGEGGLSSFK
jgi:hypothetical protein